MGQVRQTLENVVAVLAGAQGARRVVGDVADAGAIRRRGADMRISTTDLKELQVGLSEPYIGWFFRRGARGWLRLRTVVLLMKP